MAKYKIIFHYSDGEVDEEDNYGMYYNSKAEAKEDAEYRLSCRAQGAGILHMSNPGDYPLDDDFDGDTFEIVKVE